MSAFRFPCFAASLLTLAIAVPAWSQSPGSGTAPANNFDEALKRHINRSGQVGTPSVTVNPILHETGSPSAPACPQCEAASLQLESEGCCAGCGSVAAAPIRKTYSLAEVCDDPAFGAWVAEMIPQVVQPGSWNKGEAPNRRVLSYFAPAKMLLVYHTPAAHAEIDDLLRGMKRSMPTARATTRATAKAPALFGLCKTQFAAPEPVAAPAPAQNGYPIAAPAQQPRHLFHFIIRYEGDGIIDRNVAEFAKVYADAAASSATAAVNQAPPTPTKNNAPAKDATEDIDELPPATPTKSETRARTVTPGYSIAPASCTMPATCPPSYAPSGGATLPLAPRASSQPSTVRTTPAPAPNYPVPATPPATRDDDEE